MGIRSQGNCGVVLEREFGSGGFVAVLIEVLIFFLHPPECPPSCVHHARGPARRGLHRLVQLPPLQGALLNPLGNDAVLRHVAAGGLERPHPDGHSLSRSQRISEPSFFDKIKHHVRPSQNPS